MTTEQADVRNGIDWGKFEEALRYLPPERLFLNPDCGFGTFASRPMNTVEVATRKLSIIAQAAALLREKYKAAADD